MAGTQTGRTSKSQTAVSQCGSESEGKSGAWAETTQDYMDGTTLSFENQARLSFLSSNKTKTYFIVPSEKNLQLGWKTSSELMIKPRAWGEYGARGKLVVRQSGFT